MWIVSGAAAAAVASVLVAPVASAGGSAVVSATPLVTGLRISWNLSDFTPVATPRFTVALDHGVPQITGLTGPSVDVSNLNPGTAFTATVTEFDGTTPTGSSQISLATHPAPPGVPSITSVVLGNRSVRLAWTAAAGATSYRVNRSDAAGTPVPIGNPTWARTYLDTGLAVGAPGYDYSVSARHTFLYPISGTSVSTSAVRAVVPVGAPGAPFAVSAVPGDHTATVRWLAPSSNGRPILLYRVYFGHGAEIPPCRAGASAPCLANAAPTATNRLVQNLPANSAVIFSIKAQNNVGKSPFSPLSAPVQPYTTNPPYSLGMRGPSITALQQRLNWAGLYVPVTGVFDAATKKQVNHLREKFLYSEDGTVSNSLWLILTSITKTHGVLPSECSGTSLCISKSQSILRYIVNGKVVRTMDARFGPEDGGNLATANGLFAIDSKDGCYGGANPDDYGSLMANCHVSTGYGTPMPWSMFFNGGQAVHYSWYFARDGYYGNSHGCINVRDWEGVKYIFDHASEGTPVYVYWG